MRGSVADIQYTTLKIGQEKKKKKEEETTGVK